MQHIDFEKYEVIDSVKYRYKINKLYAQSQLATKTPITNFCICICFKNNKKHFLSNMPDWAIEYHKIGGARSDEVFDLEQMKNKLYFIPQKNKYDKIQETLVDLEENKYGYYDAFSLIRRNVCCDFILLALTNKYETNPEVIYENYFENFEDFCISFIDNMKDEIFSRNHFAKNLSIFTNNNTLSKAIKRQCEKFSTNLTPRELECIYLIKAHYPPKIIAKNMGISEHTTRDYIKSIKKKLNSYSILEVIEKSIMLDL